MSDPNMLVEILHQILEATRRVQRRFEPVDSADYFTDSDTDSDTGMEKLDAYVCC